MNKFWFSTLWKYGIAAGILIWIICFLPLIGGWDEYFKQYEHSMHNKDARFHYPHPLAKLFVPLFFWAFVAILMFWLVITFAFNDKYHKKDKRYRKAVIFIAGGLSTAIAIQLSARDALIFSKE